MTETHDKMRARPEQRARERLDRYFGLGVEQAHQILRTDAGAKQIYDCAVRALAEAEREIDAAERAA